MSFLNKSLAQGQNNSLTLLNNGSFSHKGPWIQAYENSLLDRWHVGDFSAAEYTIFADLDTGNKEVIKALVVATVDEASIVIYARNNTIQDLIEVSASVNSSYVDVTIDPAAAGDSGVSPRGAKVIYTAHYFYTQNPPAVV